MTAAVSKGVRKAHSRHALPWPAAVKQRSFPAIYSAVKPKPAKATETKEKRVIRSRGSFIQTQSSQKQREGGCIKQSARVSFQSDTGISYLKIQTK